MKYRQLGDSGISCSVIGLGTWAMGGDSFGQVDDKNSRDTVRAAIDAGITLIDTAPAYGDGHAEEVVGEALQGVDRTRVVLATKFGVFRTPDGGYLRCAKPDTLREQLEKSLRRLRTDYIDLYQFHWPDKNTPIADALEVVVRFLQEGKIRAIGLSNFAPSQIDEARAVCPIASLQPPYSLLDRAYEKELKPYCAKNGIGVLSYGSIGAGVLSGKYTERPVFTGSDTRAGFYARFYSEENWPRTQALVDALRRAAQPHGAPVVQAAINWVLSSPEMTAALVGAKTPQQAAQNAAAADWSLTEAEVLAITSAADALP